MIIKIEIICQGHNFNTQKMRATPLNKYNIKHKLKLKVTSFDGRSGRIEEISN